MKSNVTLTSLLFFFLAFGTQSKAQNRIVYFSGYNAATATFPKECAGKLDAMITSAQLNFNGMTKENDNRTVWTNPNTATTLNIATAPYLSYTINFKPGSTVTFDRFVMDGIAILNANTKMQLRWSINNFGTSLGEFAAASGGNYTLTSRVLPNTSVSNPTAVEFRVYFYNGSGRFYNPGSYNYASVDGTPSSYTISGQNVSVWYTTYSTLPVVWQSFSTSKVNDDALVQWSTSSEVNTRAFVVQHSNDGQNWNDIGHVAAKGKIGLVNAYRFTHSAISSGTNYYRVKSIDFDGKEGYSSISSINRNDARKVLRIVANPAIGKVATVVLQKTTAVQVFTTSGHLVYNNVLTAGGHNIDLSHQAAGTYIIVAGGQKEKLVL